MDALNPGIHMLQPVVLLPLAFAFAVSDVLTICRSMQCNVIVYRGVEGSIEMRSPISIQ